MGVVKRWIRLGAVAAACVTVWLLFAPAQFGGGVTYVTTHGNSMEPDLNAGDLVLIRGADSYQPGDAVAYNSAEIKTLVLHRIQSIQDGEYTFKGDNNSWLDPDHPTQEDLVGRMWFKIPQGGAWLQRITTAPMLAAFAFVLLILGGSVRVETRRGGKRSRRRRPQMPQESGVSLRLSAWWAAQSALVRGVVWVFGGLAAAGLLLSMIAWTRPVSTLGGGGTASENKMDFDYSAPVKPSPAYQTPQAEAPDPIFRTLANNVDVQFSYTGPPGSVAVVAKLSTSGGWNWTVPVMEPTTFTGETYKGSVNLDLDALYARAQSGASATGIPASVVNVDIVPAVTSSQGKFEPALKMTLNPLALSLAGGADTLSVTSSAGAGATAVTTPNKIGLLGLGIDVGFARVLSLVLLLLGLLVLGVLAIFTSKPQSVGESEAIELRYRDLLLPVNPMPDPIGTVVSVADIADLAKLARQYGLLIMHGTVDGAESFVVQDGSVAYRLVVSLKQADPHSGVEDHSPLSILEPTSQTGAPVESPPP